MKAIIRINENKFHDVSSITNAIEHNLRYGKQPENINTEQSKNNKVLFDQFGIIGKPASFFQKKLMKSYKEKDIKVKSNNVLCLEFIATASPVFFKNKTKEEILAWSNDQVEYFKKEFGEGLKTVFLHLDESTPHLHIFVSPEQKKIYKTTNILKDGTKKTVEKEKYGLNAKRFDRERLILIQDNYANHNKKYGLERGEKGSKAVHKELKELREEERKELMEILSIPEDYLEQLKNKEKNGEKINWSKTLNEAFQRINKLRKRLLNVKNIATLENTITELEEKEKKLEKNIEDLNKQIKNVKSTIALESENIQLRNENKSLKLKIGNFEILEEQEKQRKEEHKFAPEKLKSLNTIKSLRM